MRTTIDDLQTIRMMVRELKKPNPTGEHRIGTNHVDRFEKWAREYIWENIENANNWGGGGGTVANSQ